MEEFPTDDDTTIPNNSSSDLHDSQPDSPQESIQSQHHICSQSINPQPHTTERIQSSPNLSSLIVLHNSRDITSHATWVLSSAKTSNGIHDLLDSSLDTYWQSDGSQPHCITLSFKKKMSISHLVLYLDYTLDESYTPSQLTILCGMTTQELEEIKNVELQQPVGWICIPLFTVPGDDPLDAFLVEGMKNKNEEDELKRNPMRTNVLQIRILQMHQNGKDTHMRQVKIFGPRSGIEYGVRRKDIIWTGLSSVMPTWKTSVMRQYSQIR